MVFARRPLAVALLLALAAAVPALSGCAALGQASVGYTPMPDLQRAGLKNVWEAQIGLASGEKIARAWRVGDSLYLTTSHKRLVRIIASSGVKAWDVPIGVQTTQIFRPVDLGNNRILVLNQEAIFLLDKAAGVEVTQRPLSFVATGDPVVDKASNTLCVGGLRYFHGLFLDQLGGQKWVTASPGDLFVSTPAVLGADVLIASRAGHLWRVNMANGQWDWKDRKANGAVTAPLSSDGGALYVPALDQRVYAFDAQSGGELWEVLLDGTLDKAAVPVRTQLLVPSSGKGLYSLATANGETQWMAPGVSQVATVTGDHVWAQDDAANLKSINLDSGDVISSTPVPQGQLTIYNTDDDMVFLANKAGVVGAFAPIR
jgi:outer membrane protein assembly factor BamB